MFLKKNFTFLLKISAVTSLLVVVIFNCNHFSTKKEFHHTESQYYDKNVYNTTPNVHVFNLSQSLQPADFYEEIACKKSLNYIVQTILCIHDTRHDVHVSGSIWRSGIWEPLVFKPFIDFVNKRPDSLVIDIGANIGNLP